VAVGETTAMSTTSWWTTSSMMDAAVSPPPMTATRLAAGRRPAPTADQKPDTERTLGSGAMRRSERPGPVIIRASAVTRVVVPSARSTDSDQPSAPRLPVPWVLRSPMRVTWPLTRFMRVFTAAQRR